MKLGRNDPCNCGSGKKYKNCCLAKVPFKPSYSSSAPTSDEINLLDGLFHTGRYVELESWARSFIKLYPDSGVVWKLFSLSLQMQDKDALPAMQKAAQLLPNDAEAHGNLAAALQACRQLDAAVASGRRALQIRPDFAEAHNNLGVAFKDLGQLEAALASYRKAVELKPDFAEAYNNLGIALKDLSQFDAALDSHYRALEIDPMNVGAMLGISHLCMISGDMKQAEEGIQNALKINPGNPEARFLLATVRKTQAGDENLSALMAAEERMRNSQDHMANQKTIYLQFALGKCFDDLGDYDKAFPHFAEGCKLRRATFAYDPAQTSQHFRDIMNTFNDVTMQRLKGNGDSSRLPIFVLGMPRSGTTLTEQILASHPDVFGAGELSDLMTIARRDVDGTGAVFPRNILALDPKGLAAWAADYVAGVRRHAPEARHITDKMPANFLAIGLIHLMLPNAKIIHVKRNPVDTYLSCFTQWFSIKHEYTYDLTELGRYYVDYARLMEHWRNVLPVGTFLDVQYEEIVANPETQARRMIGFCGLDWNNACMDFHKHNRLINTASMTQVRRPIYNSSVERWRPYEKFLGSLLDALGDLVPKGNGKQD